MSKGSSEAIYVNMICFKFIYLFIETHREREAQTQAEGEAGATQGARHGTRSQVSRITPRGAGGAKLLRHPGIPYFKDFIHPLMTDREREAETQAEGEAGSMQGA